MELVRGIKITDYCDQNNLSTHQRLDLFIQIVQQKRKTRASAWIADLFERHQRLVDQITIFGLQRLLQIRNRLAPP